MSVESGIYNAACTSCNLCTASKVCSSGNNSWNAKLMIVIEGVSLPDSEAGTVAVHRDTLVVQILEACEINIKDVFITYLVKCPAKDKDKPTEQHMGACIEYLEKEVERLKPAAMVVCGANAARFILGSGGTINDIRGKVFDIKIGSHTVKTLATFSAGIMYASENQEMIQLFAKDIWKGYLTAVGSADIASPTKVVICDTMEKVRTCIKYVVETGIASFDVEGFSNIGEDFEWFREDFTLTAIGFSFQPGSAYVIPLEHKESPFSREQCMVIMGMIRELIFENPNVRKIAQNAKFDMNACSAYVGEQIRWIGRIDDTMTMIHAYNELIQPRSLEALSGKFFPEFTGYKDKVATYKWSDMPYNVLMEYNGTDTDVTLRLCIQFEIFLQTDPRSYRLYRSLQATSIKALQDAEFRGALIDGDYMKKAVDEAQVEIDKVEDELRNHPMVRSFEEKMREELTDKMLTELNDRLVKEQLNVEARHEVKTATQLEDIDDKLKNIRAELEETDDDKKLKSLNKKFSDLVDKRKKVEESKPVAGKVIEGIQQKIREVKLNGVQYDGINFGSVPQLKKLLYSKSGFNFREPFKEHTASDTLLLLNDKSGFVEALLLHRSLIKSRSTYLVGIYSKLDKNDRIHTSYMQPGTTSGRLSSKGPNLQNIPQPFRVTNVVARRIAEMIRKSFVVPDGHTMLQLDFSQAELRIAAELANETTMLKAYENGEDIHAVTAARLMDVSLEDFKKLPKDVMKKARTDAKAANFGLLYGQGAEGYKNYALSNYGVKLTLKQAEKHRENFFALYPKLEDYYKLYKKKAKKYGYVRTLFGRRGHYPDANSDNHILRGNAERSLINMPVQGTAGELTIFVIALLRKRLPAEFKFAMTVHDSIIYYVPKGREQEFIDISRYAAENAETELYFGKKLEKVKMAVDFEFSSTNWLELKEYS